MSDVFDYAHALYTELRPQVYYLDHDPVLAAQAHYDVHVAPCAAMAAGLLSNAWHVAHNPELRPLDAPAEPLDRAFGRCVPPARRGAPELWKGGDSFHDSRTGDAPYYTLWGQRILGPLRTEDDPHARWVSSGPENYLWVWQLGMSLCAEHAFRFGSRLPAEPVLWTLELLPPGLGEDPRSEPVPQVPRGELVEVDGYYDAVASYRAYYLADRRALASYTNRRPPCWFE